MGINSNTTESVYETANYRVFVGPSELKDFGGLIYKAMHKHHHVVEIESTVYPRIIDEVNELELYLSRLIGAIVNSKDNPAEPLVN